MNNFCKECVNKKVPSTIKEKFNLAYKRENISKIFLECPMNDAKVAGCLIKERMSIDWNKFCIWLNDHKDLTTEEAVAMAKLGFLYEVPKKKGKGKKK